MNVKKWLHSLFEYFEQTTIHGLRYLSEGRGLVEKLIWLIVILVSFGFAAYLIYQTVDDNESEPVLTNIETALIKDVPFPAITVRADDR